MLCGLLGPLSFVFLPGLYTFAYHIPTLYTSAPELPSMYFAFELCLRMLRYLSLLFVLFKDHRHCRLAEKPDDIPTTMTPATRLASFALGQCLRRNSPAILHVRPRRNFSATYLRRATLASQVQSKPTLLLSSPSPEYLEQEEIDVDLPPLEQVKLVITDRAAEVNTQVHSVLLPLSIMFL